MNISKLKQKILSTALAIAMIVGMLPTSMAFADAWGGSTDIANGYASGDGSASTPYEISTGAELAYLAQQVNDNSETYEDEYFVLTDDIDLGSEEWTPIGNSSTKFNGTFDGDGHTVTGLKIDKDLDTVPYYAGLFGYINSAGVVKNVSLYGSIDVVIENEIEVTGPLYIGSIAGYSNYGKIINCATVVSINIDSDDTSSACFVGGIVGKSYYGTIQNCSSAGDIDVDSLNTNEVGGIVGNEYGANVTNCYATGDVTSITADGETNNVGGVAGSFSGTGCTLSYCYWSGTVTGGLGIGYNYGSSSNVVAFDDNATLLTNLNDWVNAQEDTTLYTWKTGDTTPVFDALWAPPEKWEDQVGSADGTETTGDYYVDGDNTIIYTAKGLAWLVDAVDDDDNYYEDKTVTLANDINLSGKEWTPIGDFAGTFDGDENTISGLTINATDGDVDYGLFEYISTDAVVQNVTVEGSITVNSDNGGESKVGGIIGESNGTIKNCVSNVTIDITATGDYPDNYVGGIVGYIGYGMIENSYATGDITVTGVDEIYAGGLVGYNYDQVKNCYATGDVTATGGAYNYIGGLIGSSYDTVENCYATGDITATGNVGGVVGYLGEATLSDCYWSGNAENGIGSGTGTNVVKFTDSAVLLDALNTWVDSQKDETLYTWKTGTDTPVFDALWAPPEKWEDQIEDVSNSTDYKVDGDNTTIYTAKGLAWLADQVNNENNTYEDETVTLANDIDISGKEWTPIGNNMKQFKGTFDGAGHTVTGLEIDTTSKGYYGLFGYTDSSSAVKNLGVEGSITADYDGSQYIGGIVGYNKGTIKNCYTKVDLLSKGGSSLDKVGGIVGYNEGTVENCYATGNVTTNSSLTGGIVGMNSNGTLSDCYWSGNATNGIGSGSGSNVEKITDNETLLVDLNQWVNAQGDETLYTWIAGDTTPVFDPLWAPPNEYITAVEGATYTAVDQSTKYDTETELVAYVKKIAQDAIDDASVAITVNGTFVDATAGTSGTPYGTDGTFTFTITIDGATSKEMSVTITATEYKTVTITYDINGGDGSEIMADGSVATDLSYPIVENAFTNTGYTFAGWNTVANGTGTTYKDKGTITIVSSDVTLYAQWTIVEADKFAVSGTVKDDNDATVSDVTVGLVQGLNVIAETITDVDGYYSFANVEVGTYNIVVTRGEQTVTKMLILTANAREQDVQLPDPKQSSVVDVKEDTPAVVVGGLEDIASQVAVSDGVVTNVTVALEVATKSAEDIAEDAEKIQELTANKDVEFLDMQVTKVVDGGDKTNITDLSSVLEIVILYDMSAKNNVGIYRYHDETVDTFEKLDTKPTEAFEDGKYYIDEVNHLIHIYTSKFSTYAIAYSNANTSSSSSTTVMSNYEITVDAPEGCTIVTTSLKPSENTKVIVSADLIDGYELVVLDGEGNKIEVTDNGDGKYSYVQPASDVTITALPTTVEEEEVETTQEFTDVNSSDWFYDAVTWAVENEITTGKTDTTFAPYDINTRAEAITFLWRIAKENATISTSVFEDLVSGEFYYEAVLWGAEEKIILGTSDNEFSPELSCNRAHIVTFLWRMMGSPIVETENVFTDVNSDDYYYDAVLWAISEEITTGTSKYEFSPLEDCTRGELVTFLYRAMAE